MTNRLTKLLCALLALTALFCMSGVAMAGGPWSKSGKTKNGLQGTEYYVYTYCLQVYERPSKKSDVLEIVPFAKRILFIKEMKGWAKVYTTNGRLGYCNFKQITAEDPNIYSITVYGQQDRAPIYLRPSLDAPLMGHLDRDEKTTLVAITPKHDWVRIDCEEYYGYVQRPRIDYKKYDVGKDAWVTVQSSDVLYDADIEASFSTVYFGQHVRLMDVDSGWAKIRSDSGLIGFCSSDILTDIDPNSLDITVYTQVAGNYLYTSSSELSGRRSIDANVQMLLSAVDEDLYWARVRYEDEYYYVPYVFLSTERRDGDYKTVRARYEVTIYEGTTEMSGVLTNVSPGTEMYLIGCTDNRAKVSTLPTANGSRFIGFVEIDQIQ